MESTLAMSVSLHDNELAVSKQGSTQTEPQHDSQPSNHSDVDEEIEKKETASISTEKRAISDKDYEKETVIPSEVTIGVAEEKDLEIGVLRLEKENDLHNEQIALQKNSHPQDTEEDNIISWSGSDDPENPKNWGRKQKWAATLVVSSFTFISPVSSAIVAPAIGAISKELHITNGSEQSLVLSIFVLGYAVGPLFIGPLSEMYGRVPVLQLANLFYLIFNLACGFSKNKTEIIIFRFLSGLGGSTPLAVSC